jgi:hypothetical protein
MSYILHYSDPGKSNTINIDDTQIDSTSTSLSIFGNSLSDVGSLFWENILHLSENFSHIKQPNNPIEGQFWYDSGNKQLKIYKVIGTNGNWENAGTYNNLDIGTYININTSNSISNLNIPLETDITNSSNELNAASKKYVDNWHSGIVTSSNDVCHWTYYPNKFTIINGNKSGDITLPFDMQDINYSVIATNNGSSIHYVIDNKTVNSFSTDSNMWMVVGYKK